MNYNDDTYTFVNLYCPVILKNRIEFLKGCQTWIEEHSINLDNLVIGGDVNCVDWPVDRVSLETDRSSDELRNLKNILNVTDSWKFIHSDTTDFTYIDPSFRKMNSRIDILCVGETLLGKIDTCEHRVTPCPDHKAVVLSIRHTERSRGKGYWKLNTSILKEGIYVKSVKDIILNTINAYTHSDISRSDIWELVKIRIREFSIKYCCHRKQERDEKATAMENKITNLDALINTTQDNENLIQERKMLKEQLDSMYLEKGIGAQIRSRVAWVEEGERSTSYFLAVEKHRQGGNVIKSLKENDRTYSDDNDILKVASNYYETLYTSKNPNNNDIDDYMSRLDLPILDENKQRLCDGDISIQECEHAITNIKKNKSPGDDGLPVEFYNTFWEELKHLLVEVYNESYKNETLPISMRKSIIALIYKKGDRCNITNYRPISLTNVDYRILAFVLASRLQTVISDVVDPGQVAYIRGRFIGTNIRLVKDIFDLYNEKNLPGAILFADFKKAFDTIEWNFLFKTLTNFNFGDNFQRWIKLLYNNPCAVVKNNGYFSEEFTSSRGVRQGCPVSALLFVLCMEVLANAVRQNNNIDGLNIDMRSDTSVKIVQYADDTTIFVKNTHELNVAIEILKQFGAVAGTELNMAKCEGLWLGSTKNRQQGCSLHGMKWPIEPIRYLGIYIGHNKRQCHKLNFDMKLLQIDEIIKQADKRTLTLFGKVCIIKSLAISKIIFVATCLSVPEQVIKEVDKRIFNFLWGARDRIRRKSVINQLDAGGLNMIDVTSQFKALKASWANRIANASERDLWAVIPKSFISKFGDDSFILKSSLTTKTAFSSLDTIPKFYKDVILSYNESKVMKYEDFKENLIRQPIWGNRFIKFNKKALFFKSWVKSGILAIGNLKLTEGRLDVNYIFNRIQDHRNLFCEINILQKALREAKIIESVEPSRNIQLPKYNYRLKESHDWETTKSKFYYNNIVETIRMPPVSEQFWINKSSSQLTQETYRNIYKHKVKNIKDKKIAETNFKILNNILPCNEKLYIWGKSNTKMCTLCNEIEDITHLLFDCSFAKDVWLYVSNILNMDITQNMILFGLELTQAQNTVFSLITYYIYKDWLVCSLNKFHRQKFCTLALKNFLFIRHNIYSKCVSKQLKDVCTILQLFQT
jgi:hypothetical protein